jgi:hypothetical protein
MCNITRLQPYICLEEQNNELQSWFKTNTKISGDGNFAIYRYQITDNTIDELMQKHMQYANDLWNEDASIDDELNDIPDDRDNPFPLELDITKLQMNEVQCTDWTKVFNALHFKQHFCFSKEHENLCFAETDDYYWIIHYEIS